MRILALTGNVAAGKSTVVKLLRQHGIPVIEVDALVHELQQPGTPLLRAMAARFGADVITPTGQLDRAAMRAIMLADGQAKTDLEGLVHPAVAERERVLLDEARAAGTAMVVVDIPLLFEVGKAEHYDGVLLIDALPGIRRERLIHDRGMSATEADQLIGLQLPSDLKRNRATWILDNNGDLDQLARQTEALLPLLGG